MLQKAPNQLAISLEEGECKPSNGLERAFLVVKTGSKHKADTKSINQIKYALNIYGSDYKREVLEAFLLSRASHEEIHEVLKIPAKVIETYGLFFFNVDNFLDELSIEEYAHSHPNPFGRELKISAITLGFDFLRFRFNRGNSNLDFKQALTKLVETSYVIARAAKLNPIDSQVTKEARQWMAISIKALEAYAKIKPTFDEVDDDFKLILKNIDSAAKKKAEQRKKEQEEAALISPEDILKG